MKLHDDLRRSVLQAAIEGKLTRQKPEDGTAEDLLREIRREKERLIAEGKLKREKELSAVRGDEVPFEIPESWRWVRLGEISTYGKSTIKINAKNAEPGAWILDLEDIEKGGRILTYRTAQEVNAHGDKAVFHKGDILYSKLRPYLLKILVAPADGLCTPELVPFRCYGGISHEYVACFLKSPMVDYSVNRTTYGIKMPRVGTDTMINLLVPLPPLAEQHRITSKLEALMSKLDELAALEDELETLTKRFPTDMRDSLLQAAIQGKLTRQRPEDGTAEDLLREIRREKARLIAEGKLKREKELPAVRGDEVPFEIPESWRWVRLGDVAYLTSGNQYEELQQGVPYIKVADMNLEENKHEIVTSTRFTSNVNAGIISAFSIIFPKRGGAIATNKKKIIRQPVYIDSNTMAMTVIYDCVFDYIRIWFASIDLAKLQTGTSVPQINNKDIYPLLIPLPPLAEQQRIVKRLNQLLPLCDSMSNAINSQ